jgi:hypothetical protein
VGLELRNLLPYPDKAVVILSILLCWACYAPAAAQVVSGAQSTTGIFGRLVNAQTHEAVHRAVIKVYNSKNQGDELTDGDGRFRFGTLPPGDYYLIAHRDGYSDRSYKVERSDFDEQKELPVELYPQAVITGKVVDTFGQGLQSVHVESLPGRTSAGETQVLNATETNDLGEYRLSGLDPGSYRLRAVYRDGQAHELDPTPLTMATSYYGGSDAPATITVKAGLVTGGIDFVLNPVPPVIVRGTLHTETGVFADPVTMWIMGKAGEGGHNGSGAAGTFEIGDVGPGTYTISAQTLNKAASLFGMATVEVHGEDVNGLDIVLRPVPVVEGEIRNGAGISTTLKPASIYFMRKDRITAMPMEIAHLDKDQKFTVALVPGEYMLSFDEAISRLGVQAVTLDGKPITDWKLRIDGPSGSMKLIVVLGSGVQP